MLKLFRRARESPLSIAASRSPRVSCSSDFSSDSRAGDRCAVWLRYPAEVAGVPRPAQTRADARYADSHHGKRDCVPFGPGLHQDPAGLTLAKQQIVGPAQIDLSPLTASIACAAASPAARGTSPRLRSGQVSAAATRSHTGHRRQPIARCGRPVRAPPPAHRKVDRAVRGTVAGRFQGICICGAGSRGIVQFTRKDGSSKGVFVRPRSKSRRPMPGSFGHNTHGDVRCFAEWVSAPR